MGALQSINAFHFRSAGLGNSFNLILSEDLIKAGGKESCEKHPHNGKAMKIDSILFRLEMITGLFIGIAIQALRMVGVS